MYGWVPVAIAPACMGLFGLERGSAQGQRMVHAQAADFFAGGPGGTDAALAGTRRSATATVSRDDRQISATARGLGMGRAGGRGAVVLRRRITRLTFGARQDAERGQHWGVGCRLNDEHRGMVDHLWRRL
jgi:hypothetical protein